MSSRVLVAGIGNLFLSDDGFGVEVARRMRMSDQVTPATVIDYGIRGLHLAYDMLAGGYKTTILVDAISQGGTPGDLYVFEPGAVEPGAIEGGPAPVDAHGMHPAAVLALVARLGGSTGRVLVLGCEPARLDEGIGLSPPVAASVNEAVRQVRELVREAVAETAFAPETGHERVSHP